MMKRWGSVTQSQLSIRYRIGMPRPNRIKEPSRRSQSRDLKAVKNIMTERSEAFIEQAVGLFPCRRLCDSCLLASVAVSYMRTSATSDT